MSEPWNRRQVLQRFAAASAALMLPRNPTGGNGSRPFTGSDDIELQIASVSENTVWLSLLPVNSGEVRSIPFNGSLAEIAWDPPIAKLRNGSQAQTINAGNLSLKFSRDPLTIAIATATEETVQTLTWERESGALGFVTGSSPLLGLGEGGPQFDRRGFTDPMISGQGGHKLATDGGRVPIPWVIGVASFAPDRSVAQQMPTRTPPLRRRAGERIRIECR